MNNLRDIFEHNKLQVFLHGWCNDDVNMPKAAATAAAAAAYNGLLLAAAMFVLVVDTSLMNVSISAVIDDLDTTASGVQSAIALEALVSAAFILINSKVGVAVDGLIVLNNDAASKAAKH